MRWTSRHSPDLARKPGRRLVRIAILFSDVPGEVAFDVLTRLRFSKSEARWISNLVARWQSLGAGIGEALARGDVPGPARRRWTSRIGRLDLAAFYRLALARWEAARFLGKHNLPAAQAVHGFYRQSLRGAFTEPVDLRDLAVDGDDLIGAGVPAGPGLRRILVGLLESSLDDPGLNTRDRLIEEALRLLRSNVNVQESEPT